MALMAATTGLAQEGAAATPEKVVGMGGVFFRADNPKTLAQWYHEHLGIPPVPTEYGAESWETEAGTTVFAPFARTTKYFGDMSHAFMLNFRVRDLERLVGQLRASGITVDVDAEEYPNGRFAHLFDPEGNKVELWQPKAAK